MESLHIVYKDITLLKPHPNNARTHSKKQIQQIARSMDMFGFTNPVLTDADGSVIAGHGRIEAAKLLGMATVPTISLEHMTQKEIIAYRIADNKLAELAGWDSDILKIEFQNLIEIDSSFDLTSTGFETSELDIILKPAADPKKDGADDMSDMLKPEAISRTGDLWLLGDHRLLCGNALNRDDYVRLMNGVTAQMIFSDPPFNLKVKNIVGLGKVQHEEFAMASGEMSREEFTAFLTTALGNCAAFSSDGSIHFVCMDWRHCEELAAVGRAVYCTPSGPVGQLRANP